MSLVCIDEKKLLKYIESLLKTHIEKIVMPGYEVDPRIKAEPIVQGRQQRSKRPSGGRNQARRGKPSSRSGNSSSRGGNPNARGGQRKRSGGRKRRAS